MSEPRWLGFAKAEIGTKEVPGPNNNKRVSVYFNEAIGKFMPDSVPWCAAFVGSMLARAGHKPSGSLMARSYMTWGQKLTKPVRGCVVVFSRGRPPSGHVAFYDGEAGGYVYVIGGNQSDAVTRQGYPKRRVLGYRWPKNVATP
jgi:uncharacterized protein (TIGR02594 family)